MTKWRFSGSNQAVKTAAGDKVGDGIVLNGQRGYALYGPYVDLPAGECTARLLLDSGARGFGRLEVTADSGAKLLASVDADLATAGPSGFEVKTRLEHPVHNLEIRLCVQEGASAVVSAVEIEIEQPTPPTVSPARPVGYESRKTYADKIASGFFSKYLAGSSVLEIGYKGYWGKTVPIVPQAIGIDVGYPGYDGITLPFADGTVDAIYSSHCFEHIGDYVAVLRDWYRLLKIGGYLIIVVPHQYLFEKRSALPSKGNDDHKRFYTPESLLGEIAESFLPNSYRVRHLCENDQDFNYRDPPWANSYGQYEIELVIEKIQKPYWNLDDKSVRPYGAAEFSTNHHRADPWTIDFAASGEGDCAIWGPYIRLGPGDYVARFALSSPDEEKGLPIGLVCDVAQGAKQIAVRTVGLGEEHATDLSVSFSSGSYEDLIEFRVFAPCQPTNTSVRFKGVELRYRDQPS